MLNENFVIVGSVIFLLGSIGYLVETVQGKVRPNRVSWFLWALAPMIAFFAQLQQGVGLQALLTLVIGFIGTSVFIASLVNKKAYWQISKLDIICGILSFLGLILWYITKTGNIAIFFSILSDGLAAMPTIIKSFKDPSSENWVLYFTNSLSALITLFTIKIWNFQTFGFPLYIFLCSGFIAFLVRSRVGEKLKKIK